MWDAIRRLVNFPGRTAYNYASRRTLSFHQLSQVGVMR